MQRRAGLWQSLAFWRSFAIGLGGACGGKHRRRWSIRRTGAALGPPLLAQLDAESGQPSFVAAVNTGGDSLTIVPAALLTGEQQKRSSNCG